MPSVDSVIPGIDPSLIKKADSAKDRAQETRDQFLKILITELSQQDPFNPMENNEFLSQVADIHNLEASAELTEGIKSLTKFQEMASASAMIGKHILAQADDGSLVEGTVDKVVANGGKVRLVVGDQEVALANVHEVSGE